MLRNMQKAVVFSSPLTLPGPSSLQTTLVPSIVFNRFIGHLFYFGAKGDTILEPLDFNCVGVIIE